MLKVKLKRKIKRRKNKIKFKNLQIGRAHV